MKPKVFVLYPSLDAKPNLKSFHSLWTHVTNSNADVQLYYRMGESLIQRLRNLAFYDFLQSGYDYFFSLDSDIEILNDPINDNILTKLISDAECHGIDWNGGLYSVKKPFSFVSASCAKDTSQLKFNNGIIEMRWLSSGCWFIKRKVIEDMCNYYTNEMYDGDEQDKGKRICGITNPFIYHITREMSGLDHDVDKLLSEDWACNQRWLDMGGKIHANTSIMLNHVGNFDHLMLFPKPEEAKEVKETPNTGEIKIVY